MFSLSGTARRLALMSNLQEREIEKVNAFYLQKEAEVRWSVDVDKGACSG
jgi:hypothetical protein